MKAFILSRTDLSVRLMVDIIQYSGCPISVMNLSDYGTVDVIGRVGTQYVCDFLSIDSNVFYISSVSYKRDTDSTTMNVRCALATFEMVKHLKPGGTSIKAYAALNQLAMETTGAYLSYYAGATISAPTGTYVDPVFSSSYVQDYVTSSYSVYGRIVQDGALGSIIGFYKNEDVYVGKICGSEEYTFDNIGSNGFYSLADFLMLFQNYGVNYLTSDGAAGYTIGAFTMEYDSGGLYLLKKSNTFSTLGSRVYYPKVVIDSNNPLISEDYAEGDYYSQVSIYKGATRYNYARYINSRGAIIAPREQGVPLNSTGLNPIAGDSTAARVPYGKWGFETTTKYNSTTLPEYVASKYWDAGSDSYKIVFASKTAYYVKQKLTLLYPDGEYRDLTITNTAISSAYPGMYVYTCGGLAVSLTDKLKALK